MLYAASGSLIKRELPHSPLPLQSHFHAPNKGASVNRLSSPSLRDVLNDLERVFSLIFPSPLQNPQQRPVVDPTKNIARAHPAKNIVPRGDDKKTA